MSDFIEIIKKAAVNAVEANKPINVLFGFVIDDDPLQISIDQNMTLNSDSLILMNAVKEHTFEVTIDDITENTTVADTSHNVRAGRQRYTAHNGLAAGEKVILLRMQGGQKYIVLDRLT